MVFVTNFATFFICVTLHRVCAVEYCYQRHCTSCPEDYFTIDICDNANSLCVSHVYNNTAGEIEKLKGCVSPENVEEWRKSCMGSYDKGAFCYLCNEELCNYEDVQNVLDTAMYDGVETT